MSAVCAVPNLLSMSVTRMRGCLATRCAAFRLSSNGAVSRVLFSGFCGVSIHQTSSSRNRFKASSEMCLWPSWAGLNDPPSRPILRVLKDYIQAQFNTRQGPSVPHTSNIRCRRARGKSWGARVFRMCVMDDIGLSREQHT